MISAARVPKISIPRIPKIGVPHVPKISIPRIPKIGVPHVPKIGAALAASLAVARQFVTRAATSLAFAGQFVSRATRTPAFGVAVIASVVFAGVVGAAAPPFPGPRSTLHDAAITPVAAVAPASTDPSGPLVIAVQHPPSAFHIAAATLSAPPPTFVVNAPGVLRIPTMALAAYRNAEAKMAASDPACGISWNLLAGIGRIESMHANGGATDARGTAVRPIYGPSLDGTLPGNEVIVQNSTGGRVTYARAMGPMQFLPGTWARYASDGDGDGVADPQNLYDSTLAAARYLCSGGLNMRDPTQVMSAILRYNNSMPYARNVLGWAAAYATGVAPVDLPPLVGGPPPLGDLHLENPEGIGPGLPLNIHGLSSTDPLARMPLIDLSGQPGVAAQQPMWPWQQSTPRAPSCTVICIGQESVQPQQVWPNLSPANPLAPAVPPPSAGLPPAPVMAAPPSAMPPTAPLAPAAGALPAGPPSGQPPGPAQAPPAGARPPGPAGNAPPATGPVPGPVS